MSRGTHRIKVGIADYAVVTEPSTLSTSGLGSCLGIALFDEAAGVAALLHVMLPSASSPCTSPAKFVDTGVETALEEMKHAGADCDQIQAKVAGGSTMLDLNMADGSIGDRNIDAIHQVLDDEGITLVAEDVGGSYGRSLRFDSETSELHIKTAYKGECVI